MSKKVYVLLAEGFELIEAMIPVDVLRRGGVEVVTVSITDNREVTSAQKVPVISDTPLKEKDITDGDMIILPGGYPGYVNLGESQEVGKVLKYYVENNKFVGAICGAPTVLAKNEVFLGKELTCHSSVVEEMKGYNYNGSKAFTDGNLITGMGAGLALNFAFALAEKLLDNETILKVKKGMELI